LVGEQVSQFFTLRLQNCRISAVVVQKFQFLNNSNEEPWGNPEVRARADEEPPSNHTAANGGICCSHEGLTPAGISSVHPKAPPRKQLPGHVPFTTNHKSKTVKIFTCFFLN
jgi:hypothetical protein